MAVWQSCSILEAPLAEAVVSLGCTPGVPERPAPFLGLSHGHKASTNTRIRSELLETKDSHSSDAEGRKEKKEASKKARAAWLEHLSRKVWAAAKPGLCIHRRDADACQYLFLGRHERFQGLIHGS